MNAPYLSDTYPEKLSGKEDTTLYIGEMPENPRNYPVIASAIEEAKKQFKDGKNVAIIEIPNINDRWNVFNFFTDNDQYADIKGKFVGISSRPMTRRMSLSETASVLKNYGTLHSIDYVFPDFGGVTAALEKANA